MSEMLTMNAADVLWRCRLSRGTRDSDALLCQYTVFRFFHGSENKMNRNGEVGES